MNDEDAKRLAGSAPPDDVVRLADSAYAAKQPPLTPAADAEEFVRTVCSDVLDKQYRLYSWNDMKTQALITTNSVLFAAVGFLFKECLRDTVAMVLLGMAVLFLGSSLMICLIQVIPRLSSGRSGSEPNTRSLRGITLFKTFQDYCTAFRSSTRDTIITDTLRQVYGMANNNRRSMKITKAGVILTLFGVVMILGAIFTSAIAARGYHAFGSWQIDTASESTSPSVSQSNGRPSQAQPAAPLTGKSSVPAARTPAPPAPPSQPKGKKHP